MLIPYEQYYIQTLYREGKLIPEQSPGEINPLFQMVINTNPLISHEQTSCASACNTDTTQTQPHQISNTQRTEVCTISNSHNQVH